MPSMAMMWEYGWVRRHVNFLKERKNKMKKDKMMGNGGLVSFYDFKGDLPKVFFALYSDGSGGNIFVKSKDKNEWKGVEWDGDGDGCVRKDWFEDAGYLWFVKLPDDFPVWKG
jgi:hypothetical protein